MATYWIMPISTVLEGKVSVVMCQVNIVGNATLVLPPILILELTYLYLQCLCYSSY